MASLCVLRRSTFLVPSVRQGPQALTTLQSDPLRLCRACSQQAPTKLSPRQRRMERSELLRQNRRNPDLERAARTSSLVVPLDAVQNEWQQNRGLDQLQVAGEHFHLLQHLYQRHFRPRSFMRVEYRSAAVHRGTVLTPSQASSPPAVSSLPTDQLCSLVLSDPDGHLLDHERELLHWMVLNIRGGELATGEEVCPYLQPVPPRGSGLHRYIFSLFSHEEPLDVEGAWPLLEGSWLDQRTFSTAEFLSSNPFLQPHTFSLFQAQWDSSVHNMYMESLVHPEPVYSVEKEVTARKRRQALTRERKANHYRVM